MPKFERPNTRLKNGIQVPKRFMSPAEDIEPPVRACKRRKKGNSEETNLNVQKPNSNCNDVRVVEFKQREGDVSNNNASSVVLPDPEKLVLTKWGDVTIVGKKKPVMQEDGLIDDGIQVMVEDETDELDYIDDVDQGKDQNLSSDDDVQLGGTAADTSINKSHESVNHTGGAMTDEEIKILEDNPKVHSIINKLLDERLQKIMPKGNMVDKVDKELSHGRV